jgi:hypothetical protein
MDKGAISGFTGGARRLPEISGGRTGSPGRTAGGKLQEIYAKEGMRFCGTKGSVKSGDNILPILSLYLRLLLRDIRIFGGKGITWRLDIMPIFFSVTATSAAVIGAYFRT